MGGHALEESRSFLRRGAWFGGLPAALQERILRQSVLRSHEKGDVISPAGVAEGLSAPLEGHLEILYHGGTEEEILVHLAQPGFWFGETGILAGREAVVSVLANSAVRTLQLPRIEFERIVEEEPRFYRPLAGLGIERYAT